MKNTTLKALAVLAVTAALVSCKKDKDKTTPTTTNTQPTIYVKAKINDSAFTSMVTDARVNQGFGPYLTIAGFAGASTDSKAIALIVSEYSGTPGTFMITGSADSSSATCGTADEDEDATSGEIKITSVNTTVTGTFHFTTPSYSVTEGTFNVLLQ